MSGGASLQALTSFVPAEGASFWAFYRRRRDAILNGMIDPSALQPAADAIPERRAVRPRILLVEDDELTAKLLARILRQDEYEVRSAGDYKAAMRTACSWLPDLLVCDIALPGRDGLELIRTMRRAYPTLKGLAVSGLSTPRDIEAALTAGFAGHLPKPIDAVRLRKAVDALLTKNAPTG